MKSITTFLWLSCVSNSLISTSEDFTTLSIWTFAIELSL
jgi:hypothetical protein